MKKILRAVVYFPVFFILMLTETSERELMKIFSFSYVVSSVGALYAGIILLIDQSSWSWFYIFCASTVLFITLELFRRAILHKPLLDIMEEAMEQDRIFIPDHE